MIARVSHLEAFRCFRAAEDWPLDSFLRQIRGEEPETVNQRVGTAFHRALETVSEDDYETLTANGCTFVLGSEMEAVEIPSIRELRIAKRYGDLCVSGQIDGFDGLTVIDYKTTSSFTPERYLDSFQWRYYLSLTEAERFRYLIFEIDIPADPEAEPIYVRRLHRIECFRYPQMEEDCIRLARDFHDFMNSIPMEVSA